MEKVEKSWNRGAEGYINKFDPWSAPLAIQLSTSIGAQLPACGSLLEVAAGAGTGAALLQAMRTPSATGSFRHVVTDLVEPMVKVCRERLPESVEVAQADAEQLEFADASFDCYVGCLCLMITPDAPKMLSECYRVLKPGGRAALSVWGDKAKSPMMTIPPASLKACGISAPSSRSNFDLGADEKALKEMVLKAGFKSIQSWHTFAILPGATDPATYIELMREGSPSFGGLEACCTEPEPKQRWHDEMHRRAKEVLDREEAIGMDVLCFIIQK